MLLILYDIILCPLMCGFGKVNILIWVVYFFKECCFFLKTYVSNLELLPIGYFSLFGCMLKLMFVTGFRALGCSFLSNYLFQI